MNEGAGWCVGVGLSGGVGSGGKKFNQTLFEKELLGFDEGETEGGDDVGGDLFWEEPCGYTSSDGLPPSVWESGGTFSTPEVLLSSATCDLF